MSLTVQPCLCCLPEIHFPLSATWELKCSPIILSMLPHDECQQLMNCQLSRNKNSTLTSRQRIWNGAIKFIVTQRCRLPLCHLQGTIHPDESLWKGTCQCGHSWRLSCYFVCIDSTPVGIQGHRNFRLCFSDPNQWGSFHILLDSLLLNKRTNIVLAFESGSANVASLKAVYKKWRWLGVSEAEKSGWENGRVCNTLGSNFKQEMLEG